MYKLLLFLSLTVLYSCSYSQEVGSNTQAIVNAIRAVNELKFDEIDEKGTKSRQYFNFSKLKAVASTQEMVYTANNDTSTVVKGYACWFLLLKKHPSIESFYESAILTKESVSTIYAGLETTLYLHDFMRHKLEEELEKSPNDSTYQSLNEKFDSILIMNYQWKESDVVMDYLIEKISSSTDKLTKRKRWLANSYFYHNIAKQDDDYLYGTICGYPEVQPHLRSVMEKAMSDTLSDRVDYFDKWISCDILVVKIYGIEALIRLHNEGKELTPLQISTIKEYKSSYKSIQVCTKYYRERLPVKRILAKFELKGEEG